MTVKNWKIAVSYIFSIAIILAIVSMIDFSDVFRRITRFGLIETLSGLFLVLLSYIFRAIKWKKLLSPFADVPLSYAFHVTVAGFFVNNFVPLRAGEIARAFILNKKFPVGKVKIFSTIIVERVIEGFTLVVLFFASTFFVARFSGDLFYLMVLSSLFFSLFFLAFIFSGLTKSLAKKIFGSQGIFQKKILVLFEELFIGEASLKKDLMSNIVIWGSSILLWTSTFALYYLVGAVLEINIGFFELVVVLAVSSLSTIIPSAPGYIGTFEAGFLLSFAAFGMRAEDAIAMAVILHLLFYTGTTILGAYSIAKLSVSLKQLFGSGAK